MDIKNISPIENSSEWNKFYESFTEPEKTKFKEILTKGISEEIKKDEKKHKQALENMKAACEGRLARKV